MKKRNTKFTKSVNKVALIKRANLPTELFRRIANFIVDMRSFVPSCSIRLPGCPVRDEEGHCCLALNTQKLFNYSKVVVLHLCSQTTRGLVVKRKSCVWYSIVFFIPPRFGQEPRSGIIHMILPFYQCINVLCSVKN